MTSDPPMEATTVSVTIARSPAAVYGYLRDLTRLPEWSFFESAVDEGDGWRVTTPDGAARLRMAPDNGFGVVDHYVGPAGRAEVYIPMRVVANGEASEVLFTVYRMPAMSDGAYAADVAQVRHDLDRLKEILEGEDSDPTAG